MQYFYVRTSLGGALYYGNAESGNDALALTAQGQKANLAEIYNTDVKNLIYIDSKDTSTNATFWLDTRNGKYNLWYTTALSLKITADTTVTANFKVEDSGTIVNDKYFLYGSTNDPRSWEGQQGKQKYNVYEKDGKYIVTLNKEHYKKLYFAFSTSNYYKNMTPKDKLAGVNSDNPVDLRLVTTSKEVLMQIIPNMYSV